MTVGTHPLETLIRDGAARLARAGVASARTDAELLVAHVLRLSRGEALSAALRGHAVDAGQQAAIEALLARRAAREPLQHLTGRAPFRRLELVVGPGVFVPRPETEVLAGLAVDEARLIERPLVLDLCTGSGAVALAVADEVPHARVVAVELDPAAHAWALRNLRALPAGARVELRMGDAVGADTGVAADLVGRVDVLVANPPYIPAGARPRDPEVAEHDPHRALFGGGADGLNVPRAVVAAAAALLTPGGLLLMEHGDLQGAATRALVPPPWHSVGTIPDLSARDRVLSARRAR